MWGSGLITGMRITMRNLRRGPITVQYPHETIELPERARWAVRPKYDEEGLPKCTACLACTRACPDDILELRLDTTEKGDKHIEHFVYEVGACMMCGLCVEACPFDALEMSHEYELAKRTAGELVTDLLTDVDAAKPKRAERPATALRPSAPAETTEPVAAPAAPSAEHGTDAEPPAEAEGGGGEADG